MKEGTITLFGREYAYKLHFGCKTARIIDCDPTKENWVWSTVKNWDEAPAFLRKAIQNVS